MECRQTDRQMTFQLYIDQVIGIKCPLEYLQVCISDYPCFLNFMIPIAYKITNYSLHLFVSFLKEITISRQIVG